MHSLLGFRADSMRDCVKPPNNSRELHLMTGFPDLNGRVIESSSETQYEIIKFRAFVSTQL